MRKLGEREMRDRMPISPVGSIAATNVGHGTIQSTRLVPARSLPRWLLMAALLVAAAPLPALQAETPPVEPPKLSSQQDAIALRYQRFTNTLLQLAEYLRKTDPARADLLIRAISKSNEQRIDDQMRQLVELLKRDQLGDAIDGQAELIPRLALLLDLLQSEDRKDEIEREKQRLQGLLRDVNRLIGRQTEARSANDRAAPDESLERQQKDIADDADSLGKKIDQQDADRDRKSAPTPAKPGDSEASPSDPMNGEANPPAESPQAPGKGKRPEKPAKPADPKDPRKPPSEQPSSPNDPMNPDSKSPEKPADLDDPAPSNSSPSKPSPSKPSKPQKPTPGQPSDSNENQPSQEDPNDDSDSPPPQPSQPGEKSSKSTPGRQELEQAREEMRRAIEELKGKQRKEAGRNQDQAIAELLKAKEKLEEILRQLREEEQELVLVALEARLRQMLAKQITVYNKTVALAATPVANRTDSQRNQAADLGVIEGDLGLEANKALSLLKEDGSSVAFPEAIQQLQGDLAVCARRLREFEIGDLTQAIEKDVIESLEELIDALQKEIEKSKQKSQQPPGGQPMGQQGDPALVDAIAELKMLRQLQHRVNRRTKQIAARVEAEPVRDPDLAAQLRSLSAAQSRLREAAFNLATGRNE